VSVSVVIPTFRRPASLLQALGSLQDQSAQDFEILVVDNAADPAVEAVVEEANRTARVQVRYVAEPRLGLHHARHAGARAATAPILLFTDDDATFDPGWIEAYQRAFERFPEMAAAGGPIHPEWETEPPSWLMAFMGERQSFPPLSIMDEGQQTTYCCPHGYFFGVNMAVRAEALRSAGGFNPEIFGTRWLGDGESGLNRKLCVAGGLVGYVPEAVVHHHIPAARMTKAYLGRRHAQEGAADEYAALAHVVPPRARLILRILRSAVGWATDVGIKNVGRVVLLGDRFYFLRLRLATCYHLSRMGYCIRLLRDAELRHLVAVEDWLTEP